MSYINIKFNKDIRNVFKEGQEIKFNFSDKDVILITGSNGCGKSTLINSLRSHICSNKDRQDKSLGSTNLLYSYLRQELKPYTEVDTDFKNIFYLSSEFDDPLSMYNTFDACAFIDNGGWATSYISKGQRLLHQFATYMKKYKDSFDENTLLIFDEIDTGYDLKNQITFYKLLPKLCKKNNCKCICVTHCAVPFIYGDYSVYDMNIHDFIDDTKEYFFNLMQ